jgi:hypothetical protein
MQNRDFSYLGNYNKHAFIFNSFKTGSSAAGTKKVTIFMRNSVLGLYLTFFGKKLPFGPLDSLIRVWRTRISEQNFCFTSIYMLTRGQKSEGNLHNVAKKSHIWDP